MRTITAISTPNSNNLPGGVAMIRISGESAFSIAEKVFTPFSSVPISEMSGYTAAYGVISNADGGRIDDGVLLIFKSPKSYTGEDVAEITCHGGVLSARKTLQSCIDAGASLAEAGEFTKRAVLNGKLSLTQAEAVLDVINAVSEQYLACANAQKSGSLYLKTEKIAERILGVSAHIAAWLDYPDEGLDSFETSSHIGQLEECRQQLSLLIKSYSAAKTLREGVTVAIVGKPNAGKSTLMNLLTQSERSIVTDIPGTTRDIIAETVEIGGVLLRLCDCAGIRETGDEVERIGIDYMHRQIEASSLIIAVFDNSRKLSQEDYALIDILEKNEKKGNKKRTICVINKTDLESELDLTILSTQFRHVVSLCAKESESLEKMSHIIGKVCRMELAGLDLSAGFIANERQRICVTEAEKRLSEAIAGIESGAPLDATGCLLENALDALYRLSGKNVSGEIIDEVFRNFCVGK